MTYGWPAASAISLMPSRACFLVPTNSTVPPRRARPSAKRWAWSSSCLGLEQVDDVDAAALAVDEAAHLRVPAARLVAEVHTGLQQLPDPDFLSHGYVSLVGCVMRFPGEEAMRNPARRCAGQGPRPQVGLGPPGVVVVCLGRGRDESRSLAARSASAQLRWGWCGPALPSPTSGGPARSHSRAAPAPRRGRRAAASGRRRGSPVTGMREREPRGVQELALEAVAARRAVLGVAGDRMADRQQVRADLVRAARSRAARAAACRCGSARSTSKCVIASRGSSVSVEIRVRTRRSRPSGASIVPAPRRRAALDEREVLAHELARGEQRLAAPRGPARCARRRAGPDVSRSSRCTMPARSGSSPPATRPASACASVPVAVPARRVHDDARRLVDDEQVLVLPGDGERRRRRTAAARRGAGRLAPPRTRSPPASTWRFGRGVAVDGDAPAVDQPLRRRARAGVGGRGRRRGARPPPRPARSAHAASASARRRGGPSST